MSMGISVLVLAFVVFASLALGAATAWALYAATRRRWVWLLTPMFAILWLLLGAGPFLLIGWSRVARPAPVIAPAPPTPHVNSENGHLEGPEEVP